MSEQALSENILQLGGGIEACLEGKHTASALILLYSAIDTAGWLDSDQPFTTRESFVGWVQSYLLKAKPLACSAIDLYAARCGLLHTFTPDSKLSAEGRARRICYAWGQAKVEHLHREIDRTNTGAEYVAVHIDELYEGWRLGLAAFTDELDGDPARRSKVHAKAGQFFDRLGIRQVQGRPIPRMRDD